MRGDFSRVTFDPFRHFSRVLMQQGRVQLDADWNEQAAILLHYLRALAADLIGPYGGPMDSSGFLIEASGADDFSIGSGRYYVDGILCEAGEGITYRRQPDYPAAKGDLENGKTYLTYLDVWERQITYMEDDTIREVALGGPDTAARAKVVWQVKAWATNSWPVDGTSCKVVQDNWPKFVDKLQPPNRGMLAAMSEPPKGAVDPCITPPDARYRGAENQLYRVEVHAGGPATGATFKWSRENGSAIFAIVSLQEPTATLESLGRDDRLGLKVGDWVEMVDDDYELLNAANLQPSARPLRQVQVIDSDTMQVMLSVQSGAAVTQDKAKHQLLRRWDQKETEDVTLVEGAVPLQEGKWLALEDGIQIRFYSATSPNQYRTGDYWLVPARTATRDIAWPAGMDSLGNRIPLPPNGVEHHYAPLAIISVDDGTITPLDDCRLCWEEVGARLCK